MVLEGARQEVVLGDLGGDSGSSTTPPTRTAQNAHEIRGDVRQHVRVDDDHAVTLTVINSGRRTGGIGRASTRGTSASVLVSCNGPRGAICKITFALTAAVTLKGGSGKVTTVGTKTLTLAAGQHKTVYINLNAAGQRLLKSRHPLAVKLAAMAQGPNGTMAQIFQSDDPVQGAREEVGDPRFTRRTSVRRRAAIERHADWPTCAPLSLFNPLDVWTLDPTRQPIETVVAVSIE